MNPGEVRSEREPIRANGAPPPREPWQDGPPPGFGDHEPTGPRVGASDDTDHEPPPRIPPPPIAILDGPAIAGELPVLEYLVREIGLVAGGGAPHLVAGYGFSGKTVAAQALAVALASGRLVWGAYRAPPRRVLHVDLEQGERLTRRRYQRLALAMGVNLTEVGDALALAVMPPIALVLGDADRWRELMTGRDLIVVDSLRAATGGQDENSSDIRAGLDMLGALSNETGCRPLVIHHARKQGPDDPGGRYAIRGSSAIYDGVDSAYLFAAEKGEPVAVEHVKARTHGELVESVALVISDVETESDPKGGLRVQVHGAELVIQRREAHAEEVRRVRARTDGARLRKAIVSHPGISSTELRAVTGFGGDRLVAAIEALEALGESVEVRTEKRQEGKRASSCHYLRGPA